MFTLESLGMTKEEVTLSNGVRVVLFKKPFSPIYIRATFLSGGRYDPLGKEGLSHFLEHMVVAGSKKFPSKDRLAVYIERLGGGFSAYTSRETLVVNVDVGNESDLGLAIEVLSEIVINPTFDEKIMENERGSILKEMGDRRSSIKGLVGQTYGRLVFQETEMGRDIIGSEESVGSITRDDLLDHYTKMISPQRLSLTVCGDVKIDDLKKLLEKNLVFISKNKTHECFERGGNLPVVRKTHFILEKNNISNQVALILGFRFMNIFDKMAPATYILNEVLGGGRASILSKVLRYKHGLVYGVNTSSYLARDVGEWGVNTMTARDKVNEVLRIIVEEIEKVKKDGFSEEDINFAKDKMTKSVKSDMQTSSSWVSFHSYWQAIGLDVDIVKGLHLINQVTNDDIVRMARKYFVKDNFYLAIAGNIIEDQVNFNMNLGA